MAITRHNVGPRMSQAVVHGNTVYLAGQVAADEPTVKGQTQAILRKIDGLLAAARVDPATYRGYRVPDPSDAATRRDVEDIAVEEIANAALDILARYGRTPRDDLARAVAKRFGFRGLTKLVAQRVDQAIDLASRTDDADGR